MYKTNAQVLSGPFTKKDVPSYQAAITHYQNHWKFALSDLQQSIVERIISSTTRFKDRYSYISFQQFLKGQEPNPAKGFAGQPPIMPVSRQAFFKAMQELIDLGIVAKDRIRYAIDYSVHILHLVRRRNIIRRILHRNSRGGVLSTVDGIRKWAWSVFKTCFPSAAKEIEKRDRAAARKAKQQAEARVPAKASDIVTGAETQENKGGARCQRIRLHKQPDKLLSNKLDRNVQWKPTIISPTHHLTTTVRNFIMGKQPSTAERRLSSVLASVADKRSALDKKRKQRRSLADMGKLFEQAWVAGQASYKDSRPPSRITSRKDKALLKRSILVPARDVDGFRPEELAKWVTENWFDLGATHFKKSKNYPMYPAFAWFVACFDTYYEAWRTRDVTDVARGRTLADAYKAASFADAAMKDVASIRKQYHIKVGSLERQVAELRARLKHEDDAANTGSNGSRKTLYSAKRQPSTDFELMWVDDEDRSRVKEVRVKPKPTKKKG